MALWITVLSFLLFYALKTCALEYDYTATIECLGTPYKPLYNGGIITNPDLNNKLRGWTKFGGAKIEHKKINGNSFITAHSRKKSNDSMSQRVYLHANAIYSFSAWVQVSNGSSRVTAMFKTPGRFINAGEVTGKAGCWSMLKGGLSVNDSGYSYIFFKSDDVSAEISVDSASLQPFTEKEWRSHQDSSIEKTRKSTGRIKVVDKNGNPVQNAAISISQNGVNPPFGCSINKNILTNTGYQNWFSSRFRVTTFTNEMKWYSTEGSGRGQENYGTSDAMMAFARQHGIAVRGHNVLWDDPHYQPFWVPALSPDDLRAAATNRITSLMGRYKGQVIGWDVVNENIHFNFFESKLGEDASAQFYSLAHAADPGTPLFLNEYNTIEETGEVTASPHNYVHKLNQIRVEKPGNYRLNYGIGLQSHFRVPNVAYIRGGLDLLGATNYPIWLTEIDVEKGPNQANYLEQILREGHGHPKVSGMVVWAAWNPEGCNKMCLTDNNFNNFATGDVVDKLLREWGGIGASSLNGTTDANGYFEAKLFHGEYEVRFQDQVKKVSIDNKMSQFMETFEVSA